MIDELRIQNLKSHKDSKINLSNLTVLCGANGVGKSSVIQSLLLLRQTHIKNRLDKILDLNDPLCFIGKSKDALYQFSDTEAGNEIIFTINSDKKEYCWKFVGDKEKSYLSRTNNTIDSVGYEKLSLFTNDFQFLSAARTSQSYETDDYAVEEQNQLSKREGKGELTAHFLHKFQKSLKVLDELKHSSEEDEFLLSQTSAWEREISKGVNVSPIQIGDNYEIRYSFNSLSGPTDFFTKSNVGFGLSYTLPIIVGILSAKPNALLIIENPEAHVHPYGQSKLAELICLAAAKGVQVIVETHSDHIINGILIQCKNKEIGGKGILADEVKIYHIDRDQDHQFSIATEVGIEPGGRLKNRPQGFFDQIGNDIRKLI